MATASGIVRFGSFIGGSISTAAGFAAGAATAPTLRPILQELENSTWARLPTKPLDAGIAAAIVAEDVDKYQWGEDEAGNTGVNPDRFKDLLGEALNAPGLAELLTLWRREKITAADFVHGLRKAKLEGRWDTPLESLFGERLDPSQIALAIVRSLMADPGFLPVTLDTTGGKVPAYGVSKLDVLKEAQAAGIDPERLRIMVGEIGLPMALDAAAQSVFRDIIKREDFNRAVLEGDTRPEWADYIFDHARQIPSVADYVNAHIRGWINEDAMHKGAARHGMSAEDVDLLYLRTGRPAAPGQMATAAARGINGPDKRPMDREQFLKGIAESDIRPEWGEMLWESRFLYPPLFQITRLVQADAITPETARDWAVKDRYPPEVVGPLYKFWSQPSATTADTHEAKAQTQLWNDTHRAYLTGGLSDADATTALTDAGVNATTIPRVLQLWATGANVRRKLLTAAQVKKAYDKVAINAATGLPWTRDEAIAALGGLGYPPLEANDYLNIPSGK